jgi:hypothetical protein
MKTAASGSLFLGAEEGLLEVIRALDDIVETMVTQGLDRREA